MSGGQSIGSVNYDGIRPIGVDPCKDFYKLPPHIKIPDELKGFLKKVEPKPTPQSSSLWQDWIKVEPNVGTQAFMSQATDGRWWSAAAEQKAATAIEPIAMTGEFSEASSIAYSEWSAENLDDPDELKNAVWEHRAAQLEEIKIGFEAAGITVLGTADYILQMTEGVSKNDPSAAYDVLDIAFEIEERMRPTLDRLEEKEGELKEANERSREARDRREYYEAEIGSAARPTNLSYEEAEQGYRYSRQLPSSTFVDETSGENWKTEVRELPAEHKPNLASEVEVTG